MRLLEAYRSRPLLAREALLLLGAILIGLIVLPIAVYCTGHEVLGPYARGGLLHFWGDFFLGLAHGELPWWLLALGPYALVMFCRAAALAWRRTTRV